MRYRFPFVYIYVLGCVFRFLLRIGFPGIYGARYESLFIFASQSKGVRFRIKSIARVPFIFTGIYWHDITIVKYCDHGKGSR